MVGGVKFQLGRFDEVNGVCSQWKTFPADRGSILWQGAASCIFVS